MAAAMGVAIVIAMSESLVLAAPVDCRPRTEKSPGNQHGSGPLPSSGIKVSAMVAAARVAIAPL
jgi:hypothetical protein